MDEQNKDLTTLPMQTFQDVPQPKPDAKQIVGLVKEEGQITGYQLSDGRIVDKQQGVQLAKDGGIQGVGVATRKGNEYLRSLPDGSDDNNLSNLPTVKQ